MTSAEMERLAKMAAKEAVSETFLTLGCNRFRAGGDLQAMIRLEAHHGLICRGGAQPRRRFFRFADKL